MLKRARPGSRHGALLAVCLACAGVATGAWAGDTPQAKAKAPDPAGATSRPRPSHYAPDRFAGRAGLNYRLIWGIDSLSVRLVESNELVRFTYRVLDPEQGPRAERQAGPGHVGRP